MNKPTIFRTSTVRTPLLCLLATSFCFCLLESAHAFVTHQMPGDARIANEEASRLLKAKRYDEAQSAFEKAASLWRKVAETEEAAGEKENALKARKHANNCHKFVPAQKAWDEANLVTQEATRLLEAKEYDEAQRAFEKAVPLWRKTAKMKTALGEQQPEAADALRLAEICPKLVSGQKALNEVKFAEEAAHRLLKDKCYAAAQVAYENTVPLWQKAAKALDHLGKEKEVADARKYAEISPKIVPARKIWDEAELATEESSKILKAKRYDEAQAANEKAALLWQKAAKASDGIGDKENTSLALKLAEISPKLVATQKALDGANLASDEALRLLKAKRYDEAQTAYDKAATLWQRTATASDITGNKDGAAQAREIAENYPNIVPAQKALDEANLAAKEALLLLKANQHDEAQAAYDKAALLWKKAATACDAAGTNYNTANLRKFAEHAPKIVPAQRAWEQAQLSPKTPANY